MIMMALVSIAVSLMADTPHWPWGECQCQHGGERGGHCHCPDHAKMNVYCRYGGNHWICFPFGRRRRSLSAQESHDHAYQ